MKTQKASCAVQCGQGGRVWFATAPGRRGAHELPYVEFLAEATAAREALYVPACAANRNLIAAAAAAGLPVFLMNPVAVGLRVDLTECASAPAVAAAAYLLRSAALAPSLGGTHRAGPVEIAAYAMHEGGDDAVMDMLAHPLWRHVAFARVDPVHLAAVVRAALDPRWFVDPDGPERDQRWLAYFQAGPDAMARKNARRFRSAHSAWRGVHEPDDLGAPDAVFWRHFREGGGTALAEARTTGFFLEFVRRTWLNALYAGRRPASEPVAFSADHFFAVFPDGARYAAAYTAHLGSP